MTDLAAEAEAMRRKLWIGAGLLDWLSQSMACAAQKAAEGPAAARAGPINGERRSYSSGRS